MPAEIIAVQIREQGYACDKALSAKREHPELDDAVWILKCDSKRAFIWISHVRLGTIAIHS